MCASGVGRLPAALVGCGITTSLAQLAGSETAASLAPRLPPGIGPHPVLLPRGDLSGADSGVVWSAINSFRRACWTTTFTAATVQPVAFSGQAKPGPMGCRKASTAALAEEGSTKRTKAYLPALGVLQSAIAP